MKKLMIAAAIVCAAALSQAATVSWGISYSKTVTVPGSTSTALSGTYTLYVFDAAKVSGQDVIDALVAKQALSTLSFETSASLVNGSISGSKITWDGTVGASGTDYIDGQTYSFYTALYDAAANAVLITGSKSGAALDGEVALSINPQTASKKEMALASTYAAGGTGWYTAVPEPTSGLLLLLGVAGLALRRRRA